MPSSGIFLEFGGDFLETVAEMLASLCG